MGHVWTPEMHTVTMAEALDETVSSYTYNEEKPREGMALGSLRSSSAEPRDVERRVVAGVEEEDGGSATTRKTTVAGRRWR